MAKAVWKGITLAASRDVAHVEGNAYIPNATVDWNPEQRICGVIGG